ncbi:AraC family transcriptional regulator [Variovorax robiniae]|uniref:AraC family transcriptional regulator n=1 Tax=Variovorax robiniae TaxID=1836199 RepID=A0ABU8XJM5_9BURK
MNADGTGARADSRALPARRAARTGIRSHVERSVAQLCGDGAQELLVAEMARHFGASERTLERRFRRTVGVPPKFFARVMRLQAALTRTAASQPLSELAVERGYFHQAHLNRETMALFCATTAAMKQLPPGQVALGMRKLARETALATTIFL